MRLTHSVAYARELLRGYFCLVQRATHDPDYVRLVVPRRLPWEEPLAGRGDEGLSRVGQNRKLLPVVLDNADSELVRAALDAQSQDRVGWSGLHDDELFYLTLFT